MKLHQKVTIIILIFWILLMFAISFVTLADERTEICIYRDSVRIELTDNKDGHIVAESCDNTLIKWKIQKDKAIQKSDEEISL